MISTDHPALDVVDLSAGYPGDTLAIHRVNFTVSKGEKVAVIGPNGAGKSTLFKAIVGLIPFTSGHISIYGKDCNTSHNLVGYVPQQNAIDWSFPITVYDVVMMGRTRQIGWFRRPKQIDRQRVDHLLEQLSLTPIRNRPIGALSGGQKQRVFIARALAQETRVLIMDEPFTGVDHTAESGIMASLNKLQQDGITIIMSTHDMNQASRDFDKILLLRHHVLAYGSPEEVMQAHHLQAAYGGVMRVIENGHEMLMITDDHCCGD